MPINSVACHKHSHANKQLRYRFRWISHSHMMKIHRWVSDGCPGCYWRAGAMLQADAWGQSIQLLLTCRHMPTCYFAPGFDGNLIETCWKFIVMWVVGVQVAIGEVVPCLKVMLVTTRIIGFLQAFTQLELTPLHSLMCYYIHISCFW